MFTIKHIDQEGAESIKTFDRITYIPIKEKDLTDDVSPTPIRAVYGWKGPDWETFKDGSIYVMNENGKTVASYHLTPIAVTL